MHGASNTIPSEKFIKKNILYTKLKLTSVNGQLAVLFKIHHSFNHYEFHELLGV